MYLDDESVFAPCEAPRAGDRRASDPSLKLHVKFDTDNNAQDYPKFTRTLSIDQHLELVSEEEPLSGEDLGFEEMEGGEECECAPCRRLTAWEELAVVAIPLMERLRPPRADASVGTD
ncbi:NAD dependent epimerase/dehydratase family protein [Operophtera brumata]|uniref:NAD dependent epimerase/dehydratase family protein n=1 Tax=Operophtera brumata TaxID=104452 RepID=A0A0L7KVU4_OPEBR|nr:NAD dependent epimerase/dehydratase family protein [Operophtera brumata]